MDSDDHCNPGDRWTRTLNPVGKVHDDHDCGEFGSDDDQDRLRVFLLTDSGNGGYRRCSDLPFATKCTRPPEEGFRR
jgi:hypothetical protein